jgi:transmembrane sensor
MEPEHFKNIIQRQSEGTASPEEIEFLEAYYKAFDIRRELSAGFIRDKVLADAKTEIDRRINAYTRYQPQLPRPQLRIWQTVAATILVVLSIGLYFYKHVERNAVSKQAKYTNDIDPGKAAATLTLANGQKLTLSGAALGTLAHAHGTRIMRTGEGQLAYRNDASSSGVAEMNELTTAKAQTYQVILQDGTRVKLNAGSSLKFPSNFAKQALRRVELTGEAYFEVSKDRRHPFIVHTAGQEIKVLGTHFNIHAYDRSVITTLIEGKVEVNANTGNYPKIQPGDASVILKPGEQAVFVRNKLEVKEADIDAVTGWTNDQFIFKKEPFSEVMQQIAYWYDVEIIYQGKIPGMGISGVMGRKRKLSAVLDLLEMTSGAKFKIDGRRVYVIN